jgi:hypothetical protein
LFKKDKQISALQQKITELHEEIDGWRDTCRWLEARTEKLCRKYLALNSRKDDEVMTADKFEISKYLNRFSFSDFQVENRVGWLRTDGHFLENVTAQQP